VRRAHGLGANSPLTTSKPAGHSPTIGQQFQHRQPLSRRQLADKLGINYQTIGYIERGDYNPSLELALTIAELFRLPIEAIFSLKPMTPLSEEIFREPPVEPR
jgi:putative transcriptional regulator